MDVKLGDKFRYISKIPEHSFDFIVFGINKDNYDIIINRDTDNPSLYKLKKDEIHQCVKIK